MDNSKDSSSKTINQNHTVVKEIKRAFLEGWLSKEDITYALQNGRITKNDYEWIINDTPLSP